MKSRKIRVLMVDDEKDFRIATEKILNRRGFDTLMAASGQEALAKLESRPDVVILDIKMEGMDGHETLKEIRRLNPALPVIMLTGHGALPSAGQALAEGAFDYLNKPCDIDVLTAKIYESVSQGHKPDSQTERNVAAVMVPLAAYTVINQNSSLKEVIKALKSTFSEAGASTHILETGHRSILVVDTRGQVVGFLTIVDILAALMPAYLSSPKPATADSISYSPMFWRGLFNQSLKARAMTPVKDIMSAAPAEINGNSSLMEAAYRMVNDNVRRLLVKSGDKIVGILREQDLFFEMERVLRDFEA